MRVPEPAVPSHQVAVDGEKGDKKGGR